jgi:hypothetical protein
MIKIGLKIISTYFDKFIYLERGPLGKKNKESKIR